MSLHYSDATVSLHHGDCLDVLRADTLGYDHRLGYAPPLIPDASVDSVVTDPPYGLEFMGKDWDAPWKASSVGRGVRVETERAAEMTEVGKGHSTSAGPYLAARVDSVRVAGLPFQQWCEAWAAECLRVLKPGGHLLAFGGTRTWHRLACAVEDAGFEVRDSIAWLYGSGFPKSLDVSKAIDKAAGAEREITGHHDAGNPIGLYEHKHGGGNGRTANERRDIPATPAAERWQGWGTALKPAFEPVVVARKPLASPGVNVLSRVESELTKRGVQGGIRWTTRPASAAARLDLSTSSSSTGAPSTAGTSAAHVGASETPNAEPPTASSSATTTPHGERPIASTSAPTSDARRQNSAPKSSPPMATPAPAVGSAHPTSSRSTTSTEAAPLTARRPGERSTTRSSASDSQTAIESFAGIATGLTGSWATVRIDRLADGTCVWPDGLPRSTAGGSTVAANVLEHGTGALNVDACRVGDESITIRGGGAKYDPDGNKTFLPSERVDLPRTGRFPTNVVLDDTQAAALDEQSGETRDGVAVKRNRPEGGRAAYDASSYMITDRSRDDHGYGGQVGASRFFPTFRYEAKAPATERPRVNGTAHPTVKPLALMRWLVRLVTPPGGTVLEPFAGSGTTVEACILEGFHCIAIEKGAEYLPLIEARIARRRDPVRAVELSGEDAGLFDFIDGEATA